MLAGGPLLPNIVQNGLLSRIFPCGPTDHVVNVVMSFEEGIR